MNKRKVAIIGDGMVGSTIAYTLLIKELVNDIVIVDVNKDKAEGDVLDLVHGMSFVSPKSITSGDYKDIANSHIVVITAGVAQKPGESRLDLLFRNIKVFDSIIESMKPYVSRDTIVLVVTNPVDILSYYVSLKLDLPKSHIIGSGTVLDTARMRSVLSEHTKIDARNVHTFVVGEHGDNEVPAFSITTIGGIPLLGFCKKCGRCSDHAMLKMNDLAKKVKEAAGEIIAKKGSTYYAIALSVYRIIESIINDQHSVLTISTYVDSAFNDKVKDTYLSLPSVVGESGVEQILDVTYAKDEEEKIIDCAKNIIDVCSRFVF